MRPFGGALVHQVHPEKRGLGGAFKNAHLAARSARVQNPTTKLARAKQAGKWDAQRWRAPIAGRTERIFELRVMQWVHCHRIVEKAPLPWAACPSDGPVRAIAIACCRAIARRDCFA